MKNLQATVRTLEAVDEEYEWLEGDALADVVGTRYYHAAVNTPRTVLVNPAAMCRGLGETMPDNVEVYEETPVRQVKPGSPVQIECVSLSRPLTEEEQASMGGAPDWGITGFATIRRTLSNRILVRLGTYYTGDLTWVRICGIGFRLRMQGACASASPCSTSWTLSTPGPVFSA